MLVNEMLQGTKKLSSLTAEKRDVFKGTEHRIHSYRRFSCCDVNTM